MTISISVIMVTYNSSHVLGPCIAEIGSDPNIELVVVDNCSSDDSTAKISRLAPSCRIVENTENLGFAKAVNIGLSKAVGEVVVLLNPDAIVSCRVLRTLESVLADRSVGIVAPQITHPDGRLRVQSAGRFPTVWRMFTHYFGISRISSASLLEGHYLLLGRQADPVVDTDWVTGAVLAIRRELLQSIGGLNERWFMYAEDIDLCWKVRQKGLRVVLRADLAASHLLGRSDSSVQKRPNPAWIVNLYDFYLYRINRRSSMAVAWMVIGVLGLASRALLYRVQAVVDRGGVRWSDEARRFGYYSFALAVEGTRLLRGRCAL